MIGILLAMLAPAIGRAVETARAAQCMSNLRQTATHWNTYLASHQGRFTEGVEYSGTTVGWRRGEWADSLGGYYLQDSGILQCPMASTPRVEDGLICDYGGPRSTYVHGKADGVEAAMRSSYGINCWVYNPPPSVKKIQGREAAKHWRTIGRAGRPSLVPLMLDTMWRGTGPDYDTAKACRPPVVNGEWQSTEHEMMHAAMDRHNGGVNVAFLDGHVEHVGIKRLWRLKWHRTYDVNHVHSFSWPVWMEDLPD